MSTRVEDYLQAIVSRDWDAVRSHVAPDVVRVGPEATVSGRDTYVAYLEGLFPSLEEYSMDVRAVTYAGQRVFAELTEHVSIGGHATVHDEVLAVTLDDAGLIARVEIYVRPRPVA